jgi:HSP20 family protein
MPRANGIRIFRHKTNECGFFVAHRFLARSLLYILNAVGCVGHVVWATRAGIWRLLFQWRTSMRTVRPYQAGNVIEQFRDEFADLYRNCFKAPAMWENEVKAWTPQVDITESDKAYTVTADIPGVDPKDIEITVHDGVLTVRGEKREEKEDKEKNIHRTERFVGQFYRSVALPTSVDEQAVSATSTKGVLTVTIPKKPNPQAKKITVKPLD